MLEPTNYCNARCGFCPNGNGIMKRARGFISLETVWAIARNTEKNNIQIAGLGEPLLHSSIAQIVAILASAGIRAQLMTNGKLLTQKVYDSLITAGIHRIVVSAEYFGWNKDRIRESTIPVETMTIDRKLEGSIKKLLDDWGGRCGKTRTEKIPCSFLEDNWVTTTWDGSVQRCGVDFDNQYCLGNVNDDPIILPVSEHPYCKDCCGYKFKHSHFVGDWKWENHPDLIANRESV